MAMINRMKMHRFLSVWQTAINIPSRPIFLLSVLCTSKGSREKAFFLRPGQPKEGGLREGLLTCTKSDEFSRKNQTAFDPPPLIFGKLCCKFVMTDMVPKICR